jgi:hypothetical protein
MTGGLRRQDIITEPIPQTPRRSQLTTGPPWTAEKRPDNMVWEPRPDRHLPTNPAIEKNTNEYPAIP